VTNASILTVEKQICRLIIRLKVKWGATIVAQRMRIQLCASFSITKMVNDHATGKPIKIEQERLMTT
jgi:hypothetical protein